MAHLVSAYSMVSHIVYKTSFLLKIQDLKINGRMHLLLLRVIFVAGDVYGILSVYIGQKICETLIFYEKWL